LPGQEIADLPGAPGFAVKRDRADLAAWFNINLQ